MPAPHIHKSMLRANILSCLAAGRFLSTNGEGPCRAAKLLRSDKDVLEGQVSILNLVLYVDIYMLKRYKVRI